MRLQDHEQNIMNPEQERLLSPALSSTGGGGEGVRRRRIPRRGRVRLREARSTAP